MSEKYRLENDTQIDIKKASNSIKPETNRKIYQFSDGYLEESTNDDEIDNSENLTSQAIIEIDPTQLDWLPWAWYKTSKVGSKVLTACDYVGEILADLLGITSPKYQFEIDEYYRIKAQNQEIEEKEKLEMTGWYNEHKKNEIITSENNVGTHV